MLTTKQGMNHCFFFVKCAACGLLHSLKKSKVCLTSPLSLQKGRSSAYAETFRTVWFGRGCPLFLPDENGSKKFERTKCWGTGKADSFVTHFFQFLRALRRCHLSGSWSRCLSKEFWWALLCHHGCPFFAWIQKGSCGLLYRKPSFDWGIQDSPTLPVPAWTENSPGRVPAHLVLTSCLCHRAALGSPPAEVHLPKKFMYVLWKVLNRWSGVRSAFGLLCPEGRQPF